MSENIEFISAANLPTTEANEVDVLCVENGELKRKPGASLGGSSYDMKVRISFEPDEEGWPIPMGEVLEGDYATAMRKINEDVPAIVRIVEDLTGEGFHEEVYLYKSVLDSAMVLRKLPDIEILTAWGCEYQPGILPDNSVVFDG